MPIEVAYSNFNNAELSLANDGFDVINPMKIEHNHDLSWVNYMREDLKAMLNCTHIYMLKDWHLSKGANIEYNLAKDLGLTVLFQ